MSTPHSRCILDWREGGGRVLEHSVGKVLLFREHAGNTAAALTLLPNSTWDEDVLNDVF